MNPELARQHARVSAARARIHAGLPSAPSPAPEPEPKPAPPPVAYFRSTSAPHAQHVADHQRVLRARGAYGPRVADVLDVVCETWRVATSDVVARNQTARIVRARMAAMYLCRQHTTRPFAEIGRGLGGRDHSTILSGYRRIATELELETDQELARRIAACLRRLGLDGRGASS